MTTKPTTMSPQAQQRAPGSDSPVAEEHHEKVPEGAEDIEHTLRRLNAEKARRRAKNPGLYL